MILLMLLACETEECHDIPLRGTCEPIRLCCARDGLCTYWTVDTQGFSCWPDVAGNCEAAAALAAEAAPCG
jgi:hypothetical protein